MTALAPAWRPVIEAGASTPSQPFPIEGKGEHSARIHRRRRLALPGARPYGGGMITSMTRRLALLAVAASLALPALAHADPQDDALVAKAVSYLDGLIAA